MLSVAHAPCQRVSAPADADVSEWRQTNCRRGQTFLAASRVRGHALEFLIFATSWLRTPCHITLGLLRVPQLQPNRHMRFGRRNNRPRDPRPLLSILEVFCQRIRPPDRKLRHNPFAVLLPQLFGKPFSMGITPELNLAIRLHDAAHRPEGTQQPATFLRCIELPEAIANWSLTSRQLKLIKFGPGVLRHARAITFQLVEVAVTGAVVRAILSAIRCLRAPPSCA
jgi:hypothetical protein